MGCSCKKYQENSKHLDGVFSQHTFTDLNTNAKHSSFVRGVGKRCDRMNKKCTGIGLVVILLLTGLSGCVDDVSVTKSIVGVTIWSPSKYSGSGWINNTNNFSVRIKQVWIGYAEITIWIEVFEPNEIKYQMIDKQHAWYIYTLDGIEIGFISMMS